jgi:hypothetical protein
LSFPLHLLRRAHVRPSSTHRATPRSYGRRRSHASVLAELAELRSQGPLNYVVFLDDTFTIQHALGARILQGIYRAGIRRAVFA